MDVRERVATGLACAALDPRLAGILLFDLDPGLLLPFTHADPASDARASWRRAEPGGR